MTKIFAPQAVASFQIQLALAEFLAEYTERTLEFGLLVLKLEFKRHAKLHKFENFTHLFLKLIYLFLLNAVIRNKDCMWLILVACFASPHEQVCVCKIAY